MSSGEPPQLDVHGEPRFDLVWRPPKRLELGVNGLEEGIVVEAQFQTLVVAQGVRQALASLYLPAVLICLGGCVA